MIHVQLVLYQIYFLLLVVSCLCILVLNHAAYIPCCIAKVHVRSSIHTGTYDYPHMEQVEKTLVILQTQYNMAQVLCKTPLNVLKQSRPVVFTRESICISKTTASPIDMHWRKPEVLEFTSSACMIQHRARVGNSLQEPRMF